MHILFYKGLISDIQIKLNALLMLSEIKQEIFFSDKLLFAKFLTYRVHQEYSSLFEYQIVNGVTYYFPKTKYAYLLQSYQVSCSKYLAYI